MYKESGRRRASYNEEPQFYTLPPPPPPRPSLPISMAGTHRGDFSASGSTQRSSGGSSGATTTFSSAYSPQSTLELLGRRPGDGGSLASAPAGAAAAQKAGGSDGGGLFGGADGFKLFDDITIDFEEQHTYAKQEEEEEAVGASPTLQFGLAN